MPAPRISTQPSARHTRHGEPSRAQLKHEMSTSTEGSVNGKKCGRRRTSRSGPKIARAKRQQRALEVRERDPPVDREALDLREHGRVGGVGRVAPVAAAAGRDVDRRRLACHRADLHRRGVRAQHRRRPRRSRCRSPAATGASRACSARRSCCGRSRPRGRRRSGSRSPTNMSRISRRVSSIRWEWPRGRRTPGSVTSTRSRAGAASSSAAASSAARRSIAASSAARARLSSAPRVRRSARAKRAQLAQGQTPSGALRPTSSTRTASSCGGVGRGGDLGESVRERGRRCPSCAVVYRRGPPRLRRAWQTYDAWCRSVTEDIAFYVDLALRDAAAPCSRSVSARDGWRCPSPHGRAGRRHRHLARDARRWPAARRRPTTSHLELIAADMRGPPELGDVPARDVPFRAFLHLPTTPSGWRCCARCTRRWQPGGTLAFDVFHPDPLDIHETHDRRLEREPGIYERALWDEATAAGAHGHQRAKSRR